MSILNQSLVTGTVSPTLQHFFTQIKQADRLSVTAGVTIFLAAVLRLYRIGNESLWLDEALSLNFVTREFTTFELLFALPLSDPHPPLYYLLLDGWIAVFGTSEVILRLPSAMFGIGAVILIYALGKKTVDREAGIVAAGLLGLSPFHIYYSQEARMYTLLVLLTLLSFYFLVALVDSSSDDDWRTVVAYIAATVLLGYTHVYGLLIILSQNVYIGLRLLLAKNPYRGGDTEWSIPISLVRWIGIQSVVATLLGPWIGILLGRVFAISSGADTPISWISTPDFIDIPEAIGAFVFGEGVTQFSGILVQIGVLGILATFAAIALLVRPVAGKLRIGTTPSAMLFAVLFLTPLLGGYLLSIIITPIFVFRYLISASIGLFLLVGMGVSTLRTIEYGSQSDWSVSSVRARHVIMGLVLCTLLLHLPGYYNLDHKEQWREAVTTVESSASSGAAVVITDSYMDAPYRYYSERSDLAIVPVNDTAPENQIHTQTGGHTEIWVLHSHAERGSVIDHFDHSNCFNVGERWEHRYTDIRMYKVVRKQAC